MKSVLVYLLAVAALLAVVSVSNAEHLVRDKFGVRDADAPRDLVPEDYDPEKLLDFGFLSMDKETVELGLREARDDPEARAIRDSSVLLEKPAIVPLDYVAQKVNGAGKAYEARRFVFSNMDKNLANWILYPYNFTYIEPPEEPTSSSAPASESSDSSSSSVFKQGNQTLPDGAMLSTMATDGFPLHTYINWIESKTDMDIKKAKVVYDLNVAILQVEAERKDEEGKWNTIDITYDSDSYGTMFYSAFYPKYAKPFIGMSEYLEWLKSNPTQGDRSVMVYVTPSDIANGYLNTSSGENFFGLLVIPDIAMSEVSYVKKVLGASKAKISTFVNNGGVVITTGKGAFLAESWGLVPEKTFDPRYTMSSPNQTWQYNEGCDMRGHTAPSDDTEEEFKQSTLCFSLPTWTNSPIINGLISAPLLAQPETSHGLKKLLYFKSSGARTRMLRHDEQSGIDTELENLDKPRSYPSMMYKAIGKGHLVVNMGNPGFSSNYYQFVYNAFLLSGTRPIALDNELSGDFNRTIPALEQVDVGVSLNLTNYFTSDISGAKLYVYAINGTEVTVPSGCSAVTSGAPAAPEGISVGSVYLCTTDLKMLSKKSYAFRVRIVDPLVTQQKKNVVILWPILKYNDPNRANKLVTVSYGVKIQAAASALLRADMNIDPSSWYPLHASGTMLDNVMNCENKEETYAYHVEHVSIVPMMSPLIDISDQIRLTTALVLDKDYYDEKVNKVGEWLFPFPSDGGDNRKFDYLDWDLLYDRHDFLCADWDEGVKLFRVARTDLGLSEPRGFVPADHIRNANYQTNNDDDTFLLKQFQFDDADKFYEHAVQRLMAFLDVSTPEGAKTYWNGNIPSDEQSASNPSAGKRRVLFVRHDVFWWKKYLMPLGLTGDDRPSFISYDRYDKNVPCGSPSKRSVQGAFNNKDGMIPAEYPSTMPLLNYSEGVCRKRLEMKDIETISNGKIKLIHYIVPIDPRDGTKAGDFYGFDASTGKHKTYPELQFVHVYALNVDIYPEKSRRGGDIVFTFDDNDLPWDDANDAVAKDYITVAADQIAVYDIRALNNNQIRIRFKRGQMPNEAYGRASHLQVFLEGTKWVNKGDQSTWHVVNMDLYEMHYNIAKPEQDFEDWSTKTVSNSKQNFTVKGAFKLPALKLRFAINDDVEQSFMNPYELREPLIRYGIYEQELVSHRAVYGSAEFHPKSEPSLVTRNGGFSTFTHVGTSSVPFREYVSTGTSLQIPAATETGRVSWDDIWGRHFVQNVRSTIFEYPPIPPPLRNFVMTTTFEILDKQGKRMLGGWRSNENVDVHVQMKLLNNYPKWFEVTTCKENSVPEDCTVKGKTCTRSRIYDVDSDFVAPTGTDDGTLYFKTGQNASYGICFADGTVRLEGQTLTDEQKKGILAMTLCAKNFNSENHSCENAYPGLPVLKRAREGSAVNGSAWNFATRVINYWPDNYIKENMWDLTHYDYDDNQFDKAYKYHMDNNLPHLGHSNTRPDNLIAFPLYKGLGYTMVYDKTYSNKRFPGYKGWWSDNLQNKDRTLVAGQQKSNDVSVGQKSLIPESEWFDISGVQNGEAAVASAEKNVYTCLFNRRNAKNYVKNTKVSHLRNVYENNIVPVPIDFDDKMEFNYKCGRDVYYSPANISQYPNTVYTETARDWLYFGANLRGGALENINVLYQLSPLATTEILFEGMAKVQDGGRFVYWNPANSKNSYLIVDNPVHIVQAKRNDIEIAQELIPTYTTTFDSVVFHHFTVSDPEEIEREWESPIYTNNYGYGDFTVQVYVGDAGTTALPSPGRTIRARITFMNNAGFDINMLKDAITATNVSQEAINSYDVMSNIVHTLRVPDAYNFMEFEIPDDLKDYVKITPCPDVVGIAGLFFDFDSINVVTIRDGWKGDYYVNIKIARDFPEEKRGRLLEIPVKLVSKYFDRLPGAGDITGAHDYTVEIPSLMFGVPYSSKNKLWADKVFYTSGYATDVNLRTALSKPFAPEDAIFVTEEELDNYRKCLGRETDPDQETTDGEFACLDKLWYSDLKNHTKCVYNITEETSARRIISFAPCFKTYAPTFPVKVAPVDGPDQAVMHLLLRTRAPQVKSGWPKATEYVACSYKDWMNKSMNSPTQPASSVHAKGAWITLKWSVTLLSSSGLVLDDPLISPNNSGLAQITVTLENTGDYYAYNVMFNLTLDANVTLATDDNTDIAAGSPIPDGCGVSSDNGAAMFWCNVSNVLPPRSPRSYPFRVYYTPDLREGAGPKAASPLNMRIVAEKSTASIDLTSSAGEKRVTQDLEGPYGLKYTDRTDSNMVVLTGRRGSGYDLTLTATHKLQDIRVYIWRARLPDSPVWTTIAVTNTTKINEDVFARFLELGGDKAGEVKVDYVVAVSRSKSEVTVNNSDLVAVLTQSNVYEWRATASNLLLLLLLLPGLAIPAAAAAAVFATTKGANKEPVQELGMASKEKFVPQELVDDEPVQMAEVDTSKPPPPLPQRAAPAYEPPEPAPHVATSGKQYAIPTGPTYLRGGVPVNVVDN